MEFEYVRYERLEDIVKITIDRPDVMNVISRKVYAELDARFAAAEEDDEIKVIVIAGAGDNFGAGHDIGSAAMRSELDEYPRDFSRLGRVQAMDRGVYWRMHDRWRNIGKPTIAMVQGYCIMGSWMLVSACDLTVAADDARFADRSVRWGGANHEYPTQFWELGIKKAKEYLWTGDFIDAQEAHRLGMVNRVVAREKLEEATMWLARRIAINSLYSLKVSKMSINQAADIMGQSAAVRASGNFWVMSIGGGKSQEVDKNDRVDWSKAQNARFDEQDDGRPW
ncbi:MAG: enoyl-CoA hydratase-related protein [Gammaproteobacteria bacterium]|nr:enoyl-CoA hydratase-related protein [Gammaproteobacteria bacterium]